MDFQYRITVEQDNAAHLSVLHGVPDLPVDVYVDGDLTLDDFNPGDLARPLELPASDYQIAIAAADAEDDSDPVLGSVDVTLSYCGNYTAAAHGDPSHSGVTLAAGPMETEEN